MTPERVAEIADSVNFELDRRDHVDIPSTVWNIERAIRQAVNEFAEEAAKVRAAVPILPDEMPDAMYGEICASKETATEAFRIVVRQTLDEYESAIRALKLPEE